jgi:hypothetical protein
MASLIEQTTAPGNGLSLLNHSLDGSIDPPFFFEPPTTSREEFERALAQLDDLTPDHLGVRLENYEFVRLQPGQHLVINPNDIQGALWDLDETAIRGSGKNIHDGYNGRFSGGSREALFKRGIEFTDEAWRATWKKIFTFAGASEETVVLQLCGKLNEIIQDPGCLGIDGITIDHEKKQLSLSVDGLNRNISSALFRIAENGFQGVDPSDGIGLFLQNLAAVQIQSVLCTASGSAVVEALNFASGLEEKSHFAFLKGFNFIRCGVDKRNFNSGDETYVARVCKERKWDIKRVVSIGDSISDMEPYVRAGGDKFIMIFDGTSEEFVRKCHSLQEEIKKNSLRADSNGHNNGDGRQNGHASKDLVTHKVLIFAVPDFSYLRVGNPDAISITHT